MQGEFESGQAAGSFPTGKGLRARICHHVHNISLSRLRGFMQIFRSG